MASTNTRYDRLSKWLEQRLSDELAATDDDQIEGVHRFEILHTVIDQPPERIHTVMVECGSDIREYAQALTLDIVDVIQEDAKSRSSSRKQRYAIAAYREDEREYYSQTPFMVEPEINAFAASAEDSEPPNEKGVTSQLMRHSEAKERLLMASLTQLMESLQRSNKSLTAENERLREENAEMRKQYEDQEDRRLERTTIAAREVAAIERKDKAFDAFLKMAPLLIAKAMNGKTSSQLPASSTNKSGTMVEFISSLTEKQASELMDLLRPEQAELVMKMMQEFTPTAETSKE